MHILTLDSNSYRELGMLFSDNIDFKYLSRFLSQGPHELILLDVVNKELLDYFKNDYIGKLINDYQNLNLRFERNKFVENIEIPDLTIIETTAIKTFQEKLRKTCWKLFSTQIIESEKLIDFLIFNKRESKKDNTRDFLIWNSVIQLASEYPDDKVVLISRDKIFTENDFFRKILLTENIKNLIVVESVSQYLSEYGLRIDFVNDKLVLDSIPSVIIEKELKNDLTCFPSYVSKYYYDGKTKPPKNESLEILNVEPYEYYTYSEDKSKVIIVISYVVRIKAIYEREKRVDLKDYEKDFYYEDIKHRIDNENRPIYENNVLFIFEGEVDMKNEKIINQKFDDFIPDWNVKKAAYNTQYKKLGGK